MWVTSRASWSGSSSASAERGCDTRPSRPARAWTIPAAPLRWSPTCPRGSAWSWAVSASWTRATSSGTTLVPGGWSFAELELDGFRRLAAATQACRLAGAGARLGARHRVGGGPRSADRGRRRRSSARPPGRCCTACASSTATRVRRSRRTRSASRGGCDSSPSSVRSRTTSWMSWCTASSRPYANALARACATDRVRSMHAVTVS